MTREEAKEWLKAIKEKYIHGGDEDYDEKRKEAIDIAIKALEQETVSKESYDHEYFLRKELEIKVARLEQQDPILDKIRAEIDGLTYYWCEVNPRSVIDDVLNIIDNYKAEGSEE